MRILLTLLRKDIANFLRNKAAVVLTFVVPVMLIYVFGFVWGLNRKNPGPSGIRLAVVNDSGHPAAQKLLEALQAETAFRVSTTFSQPDGSKRPLTEADVRTMIHNNDLRYALIIPKDLIAGDRVGINLKIFSNPQNTIESQTVNGLLQKTIFSNVPQLLGEALKTSANEFIGDTRLKKFNTAIATEVADAFGGNKAEILRAMEAGDFGLSRLQPPPTPADPSLRRLDVAPAGGAVAPATSQPADAAGLLARIVKIENTQVVGKDVKSPQATAIIGGQAVMFLLFALSGSAAAFFDEKNAGIFQRLLAAPVSRGQLLWSRFLFGVLLGLVQLVALFLAGNLLYGVDVYGHFANLVIISVAVAAACTSFGMFIAAFSPNAQAASGLATLLVMAMSATGGAWFPVTFMPEFMQTIGKFTVVYWSMEGFSRVLWAGHSFVELLPVLGILFGIAVGVMALSVWRLNRRAIFG